MKTQPTRQPPPPEPRPVGERVAPDATVSRATDQDADVAALHRAAMKRYPVVRKHLGK